MDKNNREERRNTEWRVRMRLKKNEIENKNDAKKIRIVEWGEERSRHAELSDVIQRNMAVFES
ncbi:hypothetical protein [Paenibacillus lentus]|uniref:Uncharacterized protein n=1 Tax=Paenibacillus lentus TaxID=1338368 RepID=A0A3Q8SCS7_9BACL|nr:hypothetical protein [Paenibacillus lentus]AZK47699.1 hypothetical protein EIM92_17345 [Paenibacillus lentus]